VILARRAPVGVIFRRGPAKRVLLIRWNTETDEFETGQWLKGRIYERRCDLSPGGDMLVYFAAKWGQEPSTWTAVSRPPYLTALAFWPKGDAWGGGGQFISRRKLALNHLSTKRVDGLPKLPPWLRVETFGQHSGGGEDWPIWTARLQRDGWNLISEGTEVAGKSGAKVWIRYDPPMAYRRPHPKIANVALEMSVSGISERDGAWYVTEHSVIRNGAVERLGRTEWADWSLSGDLLFARGGCLFRVRHSDGNLGPLESAVQVADFSGLEFEERKAPPEAITWPEVVTATLRR
jgi:hypothetical protein